MSIDSQPTEKLRHTVILAVVLVALALAGRVDASTASGRSCWQMKFTFIGFPAYPATFARWRFTQGGRTFATGEFSFHPDYGGFYQRRITRCVTGIDMERAVHASVRTVYWKPCRKPDCQILAAIRPRP